jgi:hypothetical protein
MLNNGKTLVRLACCALCCVTASQAVEAAPPPGGNGGNLLQHASGLFAAKPSGDSPGRLDLRRLDLRAPEAATAEHARPAMDDSLNAFPSAKHPRTVSAARPEDDLPALGDGPPMRTMSRAQELARRVQREGVPVARLWESRSALLHIGLSPRGKPGLWLIQKVP